MLLFVYDSASSYSEERVILDLIDIISEMIAGEKIKTALCEGKERLRPRARAQTITQ